MVKSSNGREGAGFDVVIRPLTISTSRRMNAAGGSYLVWLWLRAGKPIWYALAGAVVLLFYGVVPTFQPAHFGRVYAAYGGVFIVLSLLWGWQVDKIAPDRFDLIGGVVALLGVAIIMYWPRG